MSAVPSTTIEDALRTAIVATTGLAAGNVIWAQQDASRPAGAWISLAFLSLAEAGPPWLDVTEAVPPVDGAEILHTVRAQIVGSLEAQCFAGDATGAGSAVALLERVRERLRFPSVADPLVAAGVAVLDRGPVQQIGGGVLNSAVFEPRAVLVLRFSAASEVTETGTFIETVEVDGVVDAA